MASTPSQGWHLGSGGTAVGLSTGDAPSTTATTIIPTLARGRGGLPIRGRGGRGLTSIRGSERGRGPAYHDTPSIPRSLTPVHQGSDSTTTGSQTTITFTKKHSTSPKGKFPLRSQFHGKELVTVTVGDNNKQANFVVHKSLLCVASSYFSAALNGSFIESLEKRLTLTQHYPVAFEVLYQYIHTGVVQDAAFYTENIVIRQQDVLWLRVLKLADATMFRDLGLIAYEKLRNEFNDRTAKPPSQTFIDELFDDEDSRILVQEYIVAHSAFWINKGAISRWAWWVQLTEKNKVYDAAVAVQVIKLGATSYDGMKSHPYEDTASNAEMMFPFLSPDEEPKDMEDCLFRTRVSASRRISEEVADVDGSQIESWERRGSGTIRLLKSMGAGRRKLELCFEVGENCITQLELISEIKYGSTFLGKNGRVKGSFYNIDEWRLEEWMFGVQTMDLAMELVGLVNNYLTK